MAESRRGLVADSASVAAYKGILQDVLYNRPSGTRQRLAEALGNKASFISQISNPSYAVPIPTRHVETILDVCHFSPAERTRFLNAYAIAHPGSDPVIKRGPRWREAHIRVPDLQDARKNKALDDLLAEIAANVARMLKDSS